MQDSDAEREHEPTQKKLDDARRRGDIARSADANAAIVYAGVALGAVALGAQTLIAAGSAGVALIGSADRLAGAGMAALPGRLAAMALPLLPFAVIPGLVLLLALVGQRGIVFAPDRIMPRLSRIDPVAAIGHRFGRTGLTEFLKSFGKLLLVSVCLGFYLRDRLPEIVGSAALAPAAGSAHMLGLVRGFLTFVLLIAAAMGAADFLWQRFEHLRRNRMTRQEITDEHKESEGDPHVKGQRRQRAREIATNRMLTEVPKADVVIVNPTHYAVALSWRRGSGRAPVCVAKGVDAVALRIRETAAAAGVPIRSDPPTARALHATVEIGHEIRPEHYAAVAAAIRFAETMRRRARARHGRGPAP